MSGPSPAGPGAVVRHSVVAAALAPRLAGTVALPVVPLSEPRCQGHCGIGHIRVTRSRLGVGSGGPCHTEHSLARRRGVTVTVNGTQAAKRHVSDEPGRLGLGSEQSPRRWPTDHVRFRDFNPSKVKAPSSASCVMVLTFCCAMPITSLTTWFQ